MLYVTSILIGDLVRHQLCKVPLVKANDTASNCEFDTMFFFSAEIFLPILTIMCQQNTWVVLYLLQLSYFYRKIVQNTNKHKDVAHFSAPCDLSHSLLVFPTLKGYFMTIKTVLMTYFSVSVPKILSFNLF